MRDSDWYLLQVLYKYKNITKTADEVHVSQPSVTKRIQLIEDEFHVQIIERNKKGVSFTPQGEFLVKRSDDILKLISETKFSVLEMDNESSDQIKILAPNSYIDVLANNLNQFKAAYPDVSYDVEVELSSEIIKKVEHLSINLGFVNGFIDSKFNDNKLRVRVSQAYAVSDHPFKVEDLENMSRVEHNRDQLTKRIIDTWWDNYFGTSPKINAQVNHHSTAIQMVKSGFGYTISFYKDESILSPGIYMVPLFYRDGSPVVRNTWMIWPAKKEPKKIVRTFIDFMKETYKDLN